MKNLSYFPGAVTLNTIFSRASGTHVLARCLGSLAFVLLLLAVARPALAQCSATSTDGYTVSITIEPTSIVPSSSSCQYGYNYNIRFNYTVAFSGAHIPASLYTLQATFGCSNAGGDALSAQLPSTAGSGTMVTATNPYRSASDCQSASIASLGCGLISVVVQGSGLSTTLTCNYVSRPLPVTLTSFTASRQQSQVALTWVTASEADNASFTVEQSAEGASWQPLTQLPGAGTSLVARTYRTSVPASARQAYYRLRLTDTQGQATFSPVVVVAAQASLAISLAPNPNAGQQFTIEGLDLQGPTEFWLHDPQGRLCYHTTLAGAEVGLPVLPAGLYLAQVRTSSGKVVALRYVQE